MNRGRRLKIIYAMIFVVFLGSLFSVENKTQAMRLRNFTVNPSDINVELFVWKNLPLVSERFWPSWIFAFGDFKQIMESMFPVQVTWRLQGWGAIELRYEALRPDFLLLWEGVRWGVSQRGLIWPVEDPLFRSFYTVPRDLPAMEWSSELMAPVERDPSQNVHKALLPMKNVLLWVEGLEKTGWLKEASRVIVERQGGRFRLRLVLDLYGMKGVTLLLPDTPGAWKILAQALEPIVKDNEGKPSLTIDGTYSNKIIVK